MKTQLMRYLDFYQTRKAPQYAVLVIGEWGVGKTYQVLQALKKNENYYISLFGLESVDDVHASVMAAVDPKLAKRTKAINKIGETAKNMGGWKSILSAAPAVYKSFFKQEIKPDKTIVFDDLERSSLNLKNLLGVLNFYVEQCGCRVIVIAHDEKLEEQFDNMKEKLFGQTIKVQPQFDQAFDHFVESIIQHGSKTFLSQHKKQIKSTFVESACMSLRVLRHVVEDLGRLHQSLSRAHRKNKVAMNELVPFFAALNIAVRMNEIGALDLNDRKYAVIQYSMNKGDKPAFIKLSEKHSNLNLECNLLNDSVLIEMLCEGLYLQKNIRATLDNSHYFLEIEDERPWKVVMNFSHLDDQTVQIAVVKMLDDFDNYKVQEIGEILHIFGLLLMMSEYGIRNEGLETTKESCKAYIDHLSAIKELAPKSLKLLEDENLESAYDGYGYWKSEQTKGAFNEIYTHLNDARKKALEEQYPEIAADLTLLMVSDVEQFFGSLCITNNGENLYSNIPILASVAPEVFVETWLSSPKENWQKIKFALNGRYKHFSSQNELKKELSWLREVSQLMNKKANEEKGFARLRILGIIPQGTK